MCAIAGLWLKRSPGRQALQALAGAMADRMARRGPDGFGVWVDAQRGLALAHRRLSIADRSGAAAQPMFVGEPQPLSIGAGITDGPAHQALVYNGEIYNHLDWRPSLGLPADAPGGDARTLAQALHRWGVEATCRRARGMFALACWDGIHERLTLARDAAGEKPLLLAQGPWGLAFASDLAPLMQLPWLAHEVDAATLRETLQWGHALGRGTLVRGIERVMPGELQVFEAAQRKTQTAWWSLDPLLQRAAGTQPRIVDAREAVVAVEGALRESVRERMAAAVPVGVFLSGGVDSSLVASAMVEQARGIPSHSMGFDDEHHDETQAAEAIARALGTRHHSWHMQGAHARDLMPLLPQITGEPLADASQLPTTLLALRASSNLKVVLTGDGGDELFGGYPRYRQDLGWMGALGRWPPAARRTMAAVLQQVPQPLWRSMALRVPPRWRPTLPGSKAEKLARWLRQPDAASRAAVWMQLWDPADLASGSPLKANPAESPTPDPGRAGGGPGAWSGPGAWAGLRTSEQMQAREWLSTLPGDLLAKMDRATMWASIEARSPLLDARLVDLAWRLGPSLKAEGRRSKEVLRQVLAQRLDPALFDRPKRGFSAPLSRWLADPLRDAAQDHLHSLMGHVKGRWNTEPIARAWHRQVHGLGDETNRLWCLIVLEQWRRHWRLDWPDLRST